jgi:hypothetical protein
MLESHIDVVLYVTGAITAVSLVQCFAPRASLRAFALEVSDEATLFFARSAGLAIGLIGALLVWAGASPPLRTPVVTAALVGKAVFVATLVSTRSGFRRRFIGPILFDATCILLYAAYLLGL